MAGNGRKATENTRKLKAVFRPEIFRWIPATSRRESCFHVPDIFRVFLQDPLTFPHLSSKILRDPVAEMIDLGHIIFHNS
jgi:hypothetical protein